MINRQMFRLISGVFIILLFLYIPFAPAIKQYILIPQNLTTISKDQVMNNSKDVEVIATVTDETAKDSEVIYVSKNKIPLKKVNITQDKKVKVFPGGQSIGIQLHEEGMFILGFHTVNSNGKNYSPGEDAALQVGDMILSLNNKSIKKLTDVKKIVNQAGKNNENIKVKFKRDAQIMESSIKPRHNKQDNAYQIGLYIRDATTGIGTVSFYEQKTGKYGALGHVITDMDTKKPITVHKGKIVNAKVTGIQKGNEGTPGEKQAKFSMQDKKLGTITKNNPFGIFGVLKPENIMRSSGEPMEIGYANEIEKGPAHILTVVEGDKVEKFSVEIINNIPKKFPATKGIILKVTDKQLLEKTGGIVQGMSGSPIIQNGKIVGAVTHVFVNDPTSGYGVHIEWMLEEAGINPQLKKQAS